ECHPTALVECVAAPCDGCCVSKAARIELREGYAEVGDQSLHYVEAGRRRHWSSGGSAIPTSAPNWPSPTATMCPTSTAWRVCLTRRTGCITTSLNASTNCLSTSSPPPRHRR